MIGQYNFLRITGLIFIAFCLLIGSCKKKEIPGPQGEPGTPGIGGNAAISSTSVFVVPTELWLADSAADCRRATIAMPQITKNIIDNGAVKLYMEVEPSFTAPSWVELPFVTGDLFRQFGFSEGRLYLDFINIEGGIPSAPPTNNYRLVLISPI